jgi:hypothetical protein
MLQLDGNLAEQGGDRVLAIVVDRASRTTAAARRTVRGFSMTSNHD